MRESDTLNQVPLARVLAYSAPALAAILKGQTLDAALEAQPIPDDAAWRGATRDVLSTGLRHLALSRHVLSALVHRSPDAPVQALLLLAIGLMLSGRYTEFTVVDQTVVAARWWDAARPAGGFINAVLRGFGRRRAELEAAAAADPARRLNLPDWWWQRLCADHGAKAEPLALALRQPPPLILRVNLSRMSCQEMAQRLNAAGQAVRRVGPQALQLLKPIPVEQISGFNQGLVSVQDSGAQLAAPLLDVQKGMRVLDACAAPGGKTAHLLELARCHVDAVEKDPVRARRIADNLGRLGWPVLLQGNAEHNGATVSVKVADVSRPATWWDGQAYDRILLDAPCTASGVLRRHPDAPWLRRPEDVANLAKQQAQMLYAVWSLLAPAGRLLYVVCSVFAAEGREQIAGFLRHQPDARLVPLPNPAGWGPHIEACTALPGTWELLPHPDAQALPENDAGTMHIANHDGFFYALLTKTP